MKPYRFSKPVFPIIIKIVQNLATNNIDELYTKEISYLIGHQ
jgi:hypothetical protein